MRGKRTGREQLNMTRKNNQKSSQENSSNRKVTRDLFILETRDIMIGRNNIREKT
jgi:hypothetical protein